MKDDNFYMLAKTMFGLEEILAEELRKLGAQNVKPMNRAVSFKGDKGFMYKANLNLRTALRVLKPIAHFQAHDEKELYRKLCEINWTKFFDLDSTFATHATTHSEVFTHSKYASLVMKDAIADTFRKKFDKRPNVDPEMPDVSINLHIAKHTCTVSLDSSGNSLHKRGYKTDAVVEKENANLSEYIGKSSNKLQMALGKPDEDFKNDEGNVELVYNTKKYGILCERRFEVDSNSIVIGFVSNGCF